MLPKPFVSGIVLLCGLCVFATDQTQCPGKCLPSDALCETTSETNLCGNDFKCCLDEDDKVTTEPYVTLSEDAETEMRLQALFEMENSTEPPLSLSVEGFSDGKGGPRLKLKCPGLCIARTHKPFCAFTFVYLNICRTNEVCCFTEREAFKISLLIHESKQNKNEEASNELKKILLTGEIGPLDYLNCPYRCALRRYTDRCLQTFRDRYCPGGSVCCEEDPSGSPWPIPEKCVGQCFPPRMQSWCYPPRVLYASHACKRTTVCCGLEDDIARRSLHIDEENEYLSPEQSSTAPDPLPVEQDYSQGGRTWMVADPRSGLSEKSSLPEQSTDQMFQIPVSYSSDEFLIPEETSAQIDEATDWKIRPLCPGSCMSSFTRFLCFRNYTTYDGFYCPGRSVCCAKLEDVRKHEEYLKATYPFLQGNFGKFNPTCGKKGRRDLTAESLPGEWCWQIAVLDAHNQYVCGGALIDKSWVITTAQCVAGYVSQNQPVFIRAGVNDLSSPEENAVGQTVRVSNSYLHYSYDPTTLDNDIALLKLQNPVVLNVNVCLACLPTRISLPGDGNLCTLTGYGFISEGADISLKMTEAQIPIVHDMDCISNITQALSAVYILPASSFCAGHERNYCQGASGNPLVCKVDDHYELSGLMSWSVGCQLPDAPSIFVRIAALLGWINQVIATDHQLYPVHA